MAAGHPRQLRSSRASLHTDGLRGGMTEQARDTRRRASVLKREGTGWDIGSAARFLLSDQARYITGQTLVVDGGATLVGPNRASQ